MSTPSPVPVPSLPAWNDPASISLFIVSALSAVAAVLGMFHIGIPAGVSADVTDVSGIAGFVIATAVNVWSHRAAHSAVAVAQARRG
jgi:hypothetical protein